MVDIARVVRDLIEKGVLFSVKEGALKIGGKKEYLTPEVIDLLKVNKPRIMEIISSDVTQGRRGGVSYNQKSLWYINKFLPTSPAYNIAIAFSLNFKFDREYLYRAIDFVVSKHDVFRACFPEDGGIPVQLIRESYAPQVSFFDMKGISEEALRAQVIDENEKPFNLASEGVIRFSVFEKDDCESILLISIHHIAFDGWSGQIFLKDFWSAYFGYVIGRRMEHQATPKSYLEFVDWQAQYFESDRGIRDLDYWCRTLGGPLPVSKLPTDRPRPEIQSNNGDSLAFDIPKDTVSLIRAFEKDNPQTLYVLLLSVQFILVHRYSSQSDIIIGSPTTGRNDTQFWDVCGYFVNPIAIRALVKEEDSFSNFLSLLQSVVVEGLRHQDCPLGLVVENLDIVRDPSRSSIFQLMFILQRAHEVEDPEFKDISESESLLLKNMWPQPYLIPEEEGQFDLLLSVWESKDTIQGVWKYNSDLFDRESIEQIKESYLDILSRVFSDPEILIGSLEVDVLSDKERLDGANEWLRSGIPIDRFYRYKDAEENRDSGMLCHQFLTKINAEICILSFQKVVEKCSHRLNLCSYEVVGDKGSRKYSERSIPEIGFRYLDCSLGAGSVDYSDITRDISSKIDSPIRVTLVEMKSDLWSIEILYYSYVAGPDFGSKLLNLLEEEYQCSGILGSGTGSPRSESDDNEGGSVSGVVDEKTNMLSDRNFWKQNSIGNTGVLELYGQVCTKPENRTTRQFSFDIPVNWKQFSDEREMSYQDISLSLFLLYLTKVSKSAELGVNYLYSNECLSSSHTLVLPIPFFVDSNHSISESIFSHARVLDNTRNHINYIPFASLIGSGSEVLFQYLRQEISGEWDTNMERVSRQVSDGCRSPISLLVEESVSHNILNISLNVSRSIFPDSILDVACFQLKEIFETCLANPDLQISNFLSASSQELKRVERDLSSSSCDASFNENNVISLFEKLALGDGDMEAVLCRGECLSYKALNLKSNKVARTLRVRNEGNTPVAIFADKSFDALIAVLGCWKAGRPFVPLDPSYPRERLKYMLDDSDASVLLYADGLQEQVDDLPITAISVKDIVSSNDVAEAVVEAVQCLTKCTPAYIIYTSGTTGTPKGVRVNHGNLMSVCLGWKDAYGLDELKGEKHLQLASFSFDVFVGDVLRALTSGATLVLCDKETMLHAPSLYAVIQENSIRMAEFVPAVLRNLITFIEKKQLRLDSFQTLIVGSDTWFVGEYKRIRNYLNGHARLINSYGTSETTIDSCYFEAIGSELSHLSDGDPVPIGKPFLGTRLYVLGENLLPSPVGVPGELYIGGPGVSDGYLNRDDLNNERFVLHAMEGETQRLYATGDLARINPAHNIELFGRIDTQLKLNGVRVEAGEIETALNLIPGVADAVVNVAKGMQGDDKLIGYVVIEPRQAFDEVLIRESLRQVLPSVLIPSRVISIEAIPLSPNGKVDKKSLPINVGDDSVSKSEYVAPQTPTELVTHDVWCRLLDREHVGIDEDFFKVGGHSMKAVDMLFQCQDRLGVKVSLSDFLLKTTIRHLSLLIDEGVDGVEAKMLDHDAKIMASCSDFPNMDIGVHSVFSEAHGETYPIYIAKSKTVLNDESSPVIFLLDADLKWKQMLNSLTRTGFQGVLVGLGNSKHRARDYMPENAHFSGGGHERYLSFIKDIVVPFVDAELGRDIDHRVLVGHSFGGVFGSYTMMSTTDLFSSYVILEPSWHMVPEFMCDLAITHRERVDALPVDCFVGWASDGCGPFIEEHISQYMPIKNCGSSVNTRRYKGSHESMVQYAFDDALAWLLSKECGSIA